MTNGFVTASAFILSVLGNGFWQGTLLAGAALLVLRTVRGANATTRHAVLVAALLGALVLPVVTTAAAFFGHPAPGATAVTKADRGVQGATRGHERATPHHPALPSSTTYSARASAASGGAYEAAPTPAPATARFHVTLPPLVILIFSLLWVACATALVARLAVSLLYLERLKRDALPLALDYRSRLERWDAALKGTRDVRLCRSSDVAVPIAVGIFDAMILVPDHLLDELPAEDLDRVLLHELAHLRRGDDWVNALERVAEALLFFNPGIRWMVRQLDVEREVACDDWVLERRNEALPYAQCLVKLVESVAWPHRPMVAPGVFVTRRSISIRIERLLVKQRDVRLRVSLGPLSAVAALVVAVCLLGAYVAPSVASVASAPAGAAPNPIVAHSIATEAPRRHVASVRKAEHPAQSPARAATIVAIVTPSYQPSAVPSATPTLVPSPAPTQSVALPRASSRVETRVLTAVAISVHTEAPLSVHTSPADALTVAVRAGESHDKQVAMADGDFITDMAGAGYTNLSVDDLIRLKSIGVTPAYIREMEDLGFHHPSVDDLVRMRAIGITAPFARDMRKIFASASLEELLEMRAVGVTPQYVSEMRAAGVSDINANNVKSLRAVGVDPGFVRDMAAAGYARLPAEQLTQLRAVGVDHAFIATVAAHGFHNLTLDQLVRLRTSGVLTND